jgi:alkaline phosphatase
MSTASTSPADASATNAAHTSGHSVSRRRFLAGAAALATAGPMAAAVRAQPRQGPSTLRTAKNLIFLVADGASPGTLALANHHSHLVHGRPSRWTQMIAAAGARDARASRAMLITRSANGWVTDSSAASSAWGCGELFNNGSLGCTPDGRMPVPILPHAAQTGRYVGVVTTARVSHATPAGFCCNLPSGRRDEPEIARQMLDRGIDLMLGGGRSRFADHRAHAVELGYQIIEDRSALLALTPAGPDPRVLGMFSDSHMAFHIDRASDPSLQAAQPSLAEMARAAIDLASRSVRGHEHGFALQIEAARVDHAAHSNDAVALLHDMAAFDEALEIALSFAASRDDTLVIATTDHGNANPGLTDYAKAGDDGFAALVAGGRHSLEWATARLEKPATIDSVRRVLMQATGIDLTNDELLTIVGWLDGARPHPFALGNSGAGVVAAALANHTKVAFLSPNHTSDPVELTAFGPGAELFAGLLSMNDVHSRLVAALGLPPARPLAAMPA